MYQDPTKAQNPYAQPAAQDQSALTQMQSASPWGMSSGGMPQSPQPMTASNYPSYPNPAGLGSQNPNQQPAPMLGASQPGYQQSPITVNTPDTTSRGLSPWSLIGESNARDSFGK